MTIDAGVQIRFNLGNWLDVNSGTSLQVNGTEANPVSFTSNEVSPAAGDWFYINVINGGTASFNHCEIAHGGRS